MVNLRYHIVSLVAVFLALAVGVVLGAGPLQNQVKSISDGDNAQERLTATEAELKGALEENNQYDTYVSAVSQEILPGTLDGLKLVTVAMPGADPEQAEEIAQAAELAGADVVGKIELADNWISQGQREYRDTLSAPVASHLKDKAASETADDVLAQSLVEVISLTGSEPELLRQILTDETTPLVMPGTLPEEPATAAIMIGADGPLTTGEDLAEDEEGLEVSIQAIVTLANALGSLPDGAVAVGLGAEDDDFIAQLRAQQAAVTTVDQLGSEMAVTNTVLGLSSGVKGSYGQGIDAEEAAAPLPTTN